VNKALKGYSKNRFYRKKHAKSYLDNAWRESCHSYTSLTVGTGDLISDYELVLGASVTKYLLQGHKKIKGGAE
jgi:hypothetical protein